MTSSLRPAIAQALQAFHARRQRLLWYRAGICFALTALTAWLVIALLDRVRSMPEGLLPWFSLLAYGGAVFAAWRMALRHLTSARDLAGIARLIEGVSPDLRERLLSAVELSGGKVDDSQEFRDRLQEDVVTQLQKLDLGSVLPVRVLKPWLSGLGGTALVILGLACVPSLHLPGFLARAAIPFANLSRPSSVKIVIVEPAPADKLVPFASELEIVADISGAKPDPVIIETETTGSRPRSTEMIHSHDRRYTGLVSIGQGDVRYRVLAGDAISPWHTLSARARPRVIEFVKTVVPPAYSGLAETTVAEEQGDVEALEGSVVKLTLKPNQKISKVELLVNPDQADHPEAVPMQISADGRLSGEISIQPDHETWRSALVADETGFTNEESSPWQIVSIPDLPPVAQILDPQEQISLMADEVVRIQGMAGDDVGLAVVHLAYAVNGANWEQRELLKKPGKEASVQTTLALPPLQVKPGDAILIKLMATDLKGQTAESPAVRLIILEQTVDPQQRQWAQDMRRLAQQATTLSEQTREMRKAVDKVQKSKKKAVNEPVESTVARAQTELQQVTERAEDLWEQLKQAAQSAPNHLDSMDVRLLGERLTRMRHESLPQMKKILEQDIENPDSLRRAANEAGADSDQMAQAARAFATEDNAKIVAQAAQQLSRQEALLTEQSLSANRDSSQRPKWQEQQRAAIAASEALSQELETLKPVLEGGQQNQIKEMQKQLAETAGDLAASLDKPDQMKSPEHLYGAADNHRQRLGRASEAMRAMAENAGNRSNQWRENLGRQENPAITALNQSREALAQAAAEAKDPKRKEKLDRDNQTSVQRAEKQLAEAAKQLEEQAVLREQNTRTNNEAALDTNRASRAAAQLAREVATLSKEHLAIDASQKKADQLTQLVRALEADALTQEAVKAIAEAASNPNPTQSSSPTQATEQARAASEALRQVPDMLRRLKVTDAPSANAVKEAANAAQLAADASRQASDQLQALARQSAQQPNQPLNAEPARQAAENAEQKAAQLAQQLATQTATARESLAQLTPDVSDMMKAVAQDLKQTQQATQEAAAQAEANQPVDEVAQKAQDLQAQTAENAEQMESLQAALRQEANAADLQKADQRQVARMADIALAQMQQKAPQIAQNLKQAAQAQQSQPQAQNLKQAAESQQQTAKALDQLAENMAKSEDGQALTPEELAAMQNMEKDLGVDKALEDAYKRAQELAQMAQDASQNPEAVLNELEKELPKNPAMQKALSELSKQAARSSEQAVTAEAQMPSNIGLATEQAAHDLARVSRHQQRLGQKEAAQQAAQASNQLQQQAQAAKGKPGQSQKPVGPEAQTTAAQAAKATEATAAATPAAASPNPFQDIQGALLAQALDQLDQTLNPMQGQSGQQQESRSGQQQQAGGDQKQKAQQSLADAQKSQQQSMADQRNQGQTPGAQKQGPQQAQNQKQPNQNDPQQPSNSEGGNQSTKVIEGVLGAEPILVNGDWGHLPGKMAADLSEATRSEAAPEYRAAIESYYKAIATKAKK